MKKVKDFISSQGTPVKNYKLTTKEGILNCDIGLGVPKKTKSGYEMTANVSGEDIEKILSGDIDSILSNIRGNIVLYTSSDKGWIVAQQTPRYDVLFGVRKIKEL